MSTKFSATAPRFTEEADRREQEGLSPAERKEILNDVQGTAAVDSAVVETPELRAKAVAKMEEELTRIPEHEKQEYMLALEICPELVTLETDPLRFLRSEDFHAKNAARRMVTFWAMRRTICGEAAFLPLVATGHGALNADAIALLHGGHVVQLPDDSIGRSVLYLDRSRMQYTPTFRIAVLQLLMYMFCVISEEDESSQTNGFVLVFNCKNNNVSRLDRKLCRFSMALLRDCLPIKVRAMHVCIPLLKPPFQFVLPVVKFLAGKRLRRRMILHSGSEHEIVRGLSKYGIGRNIIPFELGGDYYLAAGYAEWINDRLQVERRREEEIGA